MFGKRKVPFITERSFVPRVLLGNYRHSGFLFRTKRPFDTKSAGVPAKLGAAGKGLKKNN